MWLLCSDFATVVAFVAGYDEAHSRTLLTGFREWLVRQAGCYDNHVWARAGPGRTGGGANKEKRKLGTP
jgi:hypothetical protein